MILQSGLDLKKNSSFIYIIKTFVLRLVGSFCMRVLLRRHVVATGAGI